MAKFDNFKIDELTEAQQEYLDKCLALEEPPELDRSAEIFIKNVISRYGWVKSKNRSEALRKARVARGLYKCACCSQLFKSGEIEINHSVPRYSTTGPNTLIDYLRRTFSPVEYLHCLCKPCHKVFTRETTYKKQS